MYYLRHLWQKARYNSWERLLFDGMTRLGVRFMRFYVVQEGVSATLGPSLEDGFEQYDLVVLEPHDMKDVAVIPGRKLTEQALIERLSTGSKCYALKHCGELAAFTWADLKQSNFYGYKTTMKENEAYLYDAFTLLPFRGKGLAPYIRYQVYKRLAQEGRNILYSISDRANAQSIRFKKKLHARIIGKGVYITLFKKWKYVFPVKDYSEDL